MCVVVNGLFAVSLNRNSGSVPPDATKVWLIEGTEIVMPRDGWCQVTHACPLVPIEGSKNSFEALSVDGSDDLVCSVP